MAVKYTKNLTMPNNIGFRLLNNKTALITMYNRRDIEKLSNSSGQNKLINTFYLFKI